MGRYADFSAGRPGGLALKNSGFTGVIRYVGIGSSGKRITAAEYQDYVANGVDVLLVAEKGTTDAWSAADDRANGRANATAARDDARALGIPDSVRIAAAADSHATAPQVTDAVAYARGFVDVIGPARTGFYGFVETLTAVHNAGAAGWFWLCGSKPAATMQAWVNFWQDNTQTQKVSGIPCDINWTYAPTTTEDELTAEEHAWLQAIFDAFLSTKDTAYNETVYDSLKNIETAVNAIPTQAPTITLDETTLDAVKASVVSAVGALSVNMTDVDKQSIADFVSNDLYKRLAA